MDKSINFNSIESKWKKKWEEKKIFHVKEKSNAKKFYVLDMFPYPSGAGLHMGHAFVFSLGDIFARFKRLQGFNVLYPMGYDSLGLPAENAAIKAGIHPSKYTEKSIKNFMKQQKAMGWSYDWARSLKTSDPEYYKWDQWIFLKMLEKGLAYRKEAPVNWCSKCKTVLANEQVINGCCWRHENTRVEIKHLKQWFFRITDYAEELLDGLAKLDWPENAKKLQRNWIGKSHGTEILFEVNGESWPIFTTRPDTIYGATFMVVSAQHLRLFDLVTSEQKKQVESFLNKIKSVSEKEIIGLEKQGVFTGSYATNPITKEQIPIWTGNFVLADYGSGMVMAVPAHDKRDYDFAKKYNLKIIEVFKG
jgi:leucyl-tRNA synthetase